MWPTLSGEAPLIIAHRGASGYLPEHTLEAYSLAIELGADVIEPDLVFTKDGILVARHDRYLSSTTNIADHPKFSDRKKADPDPNGSGKEDWWIEDFTLAEIKTLRARQPYPGRSKDFDDQYEIPTFEEILAHVVEDAKKASREVGVYPETKHPGYFDSIGLNFEEPLLVALNGFNAGPVFIQSFEPAILKRLKGKTDAKLIQLVYEETPGAGANIPLNEIAKYADGVGPDKNLVFTRNDDAVLFLNEAHDLDLAVHPWTFRRDQTADTKNTVRLTLQAPITATSVAGMLASKAGVFDLYVHFSYGVDGAFTDFPDTGADAIRAAKEFWEIE